MTDKLKIAEAELRRIASEAGELVRQRTDFPGRDIAQIMLVQTSAVMGARYALRMVAEPTGQEEEIIPIEEAEA